jgi:hypothetical protein
MARQPLVGQGLLIIKASQSHLDLGLLWTSDQPVAETSTWQHKHSQETDIHAPSGIQTHNPRSERPQTHASDRVATWIGSLFTSHPIIWYLILSIANIIV